MSISIWRNGNENHTNTFGEPIQHPNVYRCHLAILKDDEETFSAIVLNLPGAASCGSTEDEAISNVRQAVVDLVAYYSDESQEIPWACPDEYSVPEGAKQKWIIVNA